MTQPTQVTESQIRPDLRAAIGRSWRAVASAGANWSARDRSAFAQATISAMAGEEVFGESNTIRFVELLAADPGAVQQSHVIDALAESDEPSVVEVVSIVARTAAVVSFYQALGLAIPALPRVQASDPTGVNVPPEEWVDSGAWLPVTKADSIVNAFSIVPQELRAWFDLADQMYLSVSEMADPVIVKGIARSQHEVVASRTSYLNECFY